MYIFCEYLTDISIDTNMSKEVEQEIGDIPFINHSESKKKLDQFNIAYGRTLQSPILGYHYQLPDLSTSYVPSTTLDTSLLHVRCIDIFVGINQFFFISILY